MRVLDLTTSLLDTVAFFLATPEIIGREHIQQFSTRLENYARMPPLYRWFRGNRFVDKVARLNENITFSKLGNVFTMSMYITFGFFSLFLSSSSLFSDNPAGRTILYVCGIAFFVFSVFQIWVFLFSRYDISRMCLYLGAILFLVARVVAITEAAL